MKKIFILSLLINFSGIAFAQAVRPDPVVDMTTAGFRELKMKPEEPVESVYLTDDWVNGNVILKPHNKIDNIHIKYDIKNDLLEIHTASGIKVAKLTQLISFEYLDETEKHIFFDADDIHIKGLTGLVEELVNGEASLYGKPYLKRIHANYNPALDVGERSDRFLKQETLYLVKNSEAVDITKSGKKILPYFGDRSAAIQTFVKQQNLSYKEKNDLTRIVEEFNKIK